ncbi:MAG: hypothetical protein Q4G71_14300 [Pseudomonadota bacterium]|nr:hypothetical protein [Pseudomonadota bacterium]
MVRRRVTVSVALACILWLAAPAQAQPLPATPGCTAATELVPALCDASLPPIARVHIGPPAAAGAQSGPQEPACRRFAPGEPALRRFWAGAHAVSERDWRHALDWTACHVSGTATLADGRRASWQVSATRMGVWQVAGEEPVYLYCPDCGFAPFW